MEDKISVLIADDEDGLRSTIAAWLTDEGFAVEEAPDGKEAIKKVQVKDFDIALLDIKMPGANGLEVLRYIRKNSGSTEVVMMTGMSDVTMAVEAMKLGAREYLTKPLDMDQLVPQLRNLLTKRDAEDRIRRLQSEHTARLLYDLHNPIAGLKQSIGYLLKGMAGPLGDHQKELLGYMTNSIDKVILLLNDMMDLTKLEGGRVRLNEGIGNLGDSLAKIIQEFQIPIKSNKITLDQLIEPDLPRLSMIPKRSSRFFRTFSATPLSTPLCRVPLSHRYEKCSWYLKKVNSPQTFSWLQSSTAAPASPRKNYPSFLTATATSPPEKKTSSRPPASA